MNSYLGIDTSNYTTSVACVTQNSVFSKRQILPVAKGLRGLRQSDAVFLHLKQLPEVFSALAEEVDLKTIRAVGVSTRPRNVEGSYMPAFVPGVTVARIIASTLGVPLHECSHQDGHMMAAIFTESATHLLDAPFLAVHLSGGTTEILKSVYKDGRFESEIVGGTKDISAGQLIDRVGVLAGLSFPCGKDLEQLAGSVDDAIRFPVSVRDGYINFSGIETKAMGLMVPENKGEIAKGVLEAIATSLEKTIGYAASCHGIKNVLVVGGVASNQLIRERLCKNVDAEFVFAKPEYSTDNAVGCAALCMMKEN